MVVSLLKNSKIHENYQNWDDCKCYNSEGKDILALGSQEMPQSHTTKKPHMKDLLGETQEASAQERISKELHRRKALYGVS